MSNLPALIIATAVLVMIPGPNVALIVANSLKYGFRAGLITVLGTTAGVALQLALVVAGMTMVVELAADVLQWVKWAGVAYLVVLGIRTWREPAIDLVNVVAMPVMFWRGCLLASLNPKTLLFNAAFIPQFVGTESSAVFDIATVAMVFLSVLFVGDVLWAVFAGSARRVLGRYSHIHNRLSGAFLTAAGIGLAFSRN